MSSDCEDVSYSRIETSEGGHRDSGGHNNFPISGHELWLQVLHLVVHNGGIIVMRLHPCQGDLS